MCSAPLTRPLLLRLLLMLALARALLHRLPSLLPPRLPPRLVVLLLSVGHACSVWARVWRGGMGCGMVRRARSLQAPARTRSARVRRVVWGWGSAMHAGPPPLPVLGSARNTLG